MDSSIVILVGSAVGIVAFCLGLWRGRASMKKHLRELATLSLGHSATVDKLTAMADDERARRVQTVEAVGIVGKERDQWKEMYYGASTGHMAAQSMLMRELGRISALAVRAGVKRGGISPAVARVVDEYSEKHVGPERSQNNGGIPLGSDPVSPIESPEKSV